MTPSLPQSLFTAQQVRDNEPFAAKAAGVTMFDLMVKAGQASFACLQGQWPAAKRILVLVGSGNNGGDGYVVATLAKQAGLTVTLVNLMGLPKATSDAHIARNHWLEAQGNELDWSVDLTGCADVIVDGVFGSGLNREVADLTQSIFIQINQSQLPVLSLDVPSGIQADTGACLGNSIQATTTVCFVALKQGLVTGKGRQACGRLVFEGLGIEEAFEQHINTETRCISYEHLPTLPKRENNSHKGSHGRVLCIGGDMAGAICLSAKAALRTGAGLVKVYCPASSIPSVIGFEPSIMCTAIELHASLEWAEVIVIGPGMGKGQWAETTMNSVAEYLCTQSKPVVIDADALNLLSVNPEYIEALKHCPGVVTPHAGEAARLLKKSAVELEQNRFTTAQNLSEKLHKICVYKGAGSIIASKGEMHVCRDGNPGMATAGMGDVLTGIMAVSLINHQNTHEAALFATSLHSHSADLCAEQHGERGMIASDLFPYIRQLVNS